MINRLKTLLAYVILRKTFELFLFLGTGFAQMLNYFCYTILLYEERVFMRV